MGYSRAGFEVVGVDIAPQPHYPFEFHQGDAMTYLLCNGPEPLVSEFDAIHASPPCQFYSSATPAAHRGNYPDLIEPVRKLLIASGLKYVIENVPNSPIRADVMLCGTSFGLVSAGGELRRHRYFETSLGILFAPPCQHDRERGTIRGYGGGGRTKGRGASELGGIAARRESMGVDWMTREELNEAIPPAYTEWIGRQLLSSIETAA